MSGCKAGEKDTVHFCLEQGKVDPNTADGWGLRRAIRYNRPEVWELLLNNKIINVNLTNKFGLAALHTAARFNIAAVIPALLKNPDIHVNDLTTQGCSPVMVAVKYARSVLKVVLSVENV